MLGRQTYNQPMVSTTVELTTHCTFDYFRGVFLYLTESAFWFRWGVSVMICLLSHNG